MKNIPKALSIIIPARNEMFLKRTIEDIIENMEGNTEIIVVLDGALADPPIPQNEKVTIIYHPESIGQRGACNEAAKISDAEYIMKADAHCTFDKGFDVKMMADMQDDWTMVPLMKNLHAFDWVCGQCGHRWYQGPDPTSCEECDNTTEFEMDMVWKGKKSPNSTSYRFDKNLQFKYFGEYKEKQKGDLVETMSLQGSCFMATREKYWDLELCDESWGSWGQQGTEVAIKTWLSGGRVVCTRKTWYAHLFRTRSGFNWPYPAPGSSQRKARKISQDIFLNDKWDKAVHPLSWLIAKFAPVPDWDIPSQETSKGIVYYTDNRLDNIILDACQLQIKKSAGQNKIVSVSLEPMDFGDNIHLPLERGHLTMFKQILAGLEKLDADIVFFAEHDVLYHPSHFDFIPPEKDKFYYNTNVWKVRLKDGHSMRTEKCQQTSGLCAYRELLLEHYRKRVEMVEEIGYSRKMGFEPGTHGRGERVDDYKSESWESEFPNIDIRHDQNLTPSRWSKDQFRNQRYTKGWTEAEKVPGWEYNRGQFDKFLSEII